MTRSGLVIIQIRSRYCRHCWRDRPSRFGQPQHGCPILAAAARPHSDCPPEWRQGRRGDDFSWKCTEYADEAIRPRQPAPEQVPGQLPMWEMP